MSNVCSPYASLFASIGLIAALSLTAFGASYATARSGAGVCAMCIMRPDMTVKGLIPPAMAGIIAVYGMIYCMMNMPTLNNPNVLSLSAGYAYMGAGFMVGLPGLAAGYSIGVIGDAGMRATGQQPKLFASTLVMLVFCELFALYGFIIGVLLTNTTYKMSTASVLCTDWLTSST